MRFFVLGAGGQIGWELVRLLLPLGEVLAVRRSDLDLADPSLDAALFSMLEANAPDVVVNAAAYTAVDLAEAEHELCWRLNAELPRKLAVWCAGRDVPLIHYSTDYVFDGSGHHARSEDEMPAPLNAYGRSKLAGEQAVAAGGAPHLILRTSWIYALRGRNFLLTMLDLARSRDELRVVDDQVGAPTWAHTMADVTAQMIGQAGTCRTEVAAAFKDRGGLLHVCASGETSWHGFAEHIFRLFPDPARRLQRLVPIGSAQYPCAARRPLNSRLSTMRLQQRWQLSLPGWDEALAQCAAGAVLP